MEEIARTMLRRNEHYVTFASKSITDFELRIGRDSYSQDQRCINGVANH